MESVARILAHLATQETQVRGERGPARSAVLEIGRQLSRAASDLTLTKKLTDEQGWAITRIHDLEAEDTRLSVARSAIKIKGSAEGVAVVPPGRRGRIELRAHLDGRNRDHPPVTPRSMIGK